MDATLEILGKAVLRLFDLLLEDEESESIIEGLDTADSTTEILKLLAQGVDRLTELGKTTEALDIANLIAGLEEIKKSINN